MRLAAKAEAIADAASPRVAYAAVGGVIPRRREERPTRYYVRFQSGCGRTRARLLLALALDAPPERHPLVTATSKVHASGGPNGRTLCNRNPWRPTTTDPEQITCADCQRRTT